MANYQIAGPDLERNRRRLEGAATDLERQDRDRAVRIRYRDYRDSGTVP